MQATTRSVTSVARRAQILDATIAVVAEQGFARATFARIAEHAHLSSTRLISYHFAGKDELVAALVEHVVRSIGDHVGARVMTETTSSGRLRAYIEGVADYADTRRASMAALLQVVMSGAWNAGGGPPVSATSHVEQILRDGQEAGEFRTFDVRVMATTIQRAVEAVPFQLQADPDLDCGAYALELVELFERATRADR